MGIWDTLKPAVERYPDKIAVVDGEMRLTYAQLYSRVGSLANFLKSEGVSLETVSPSSTLTLVGGRHVMLPTFDPQGALNLIQNEKITISNLIPMIFGGKWSRQLWF